jgi:hypothetical protein
MSLAPAGWLRHRPCDLGVRVARWWVQHFKGPAILEDPRLTFVLEPETRFDGRELVWELGDRRLLLHGRGDRRLQIVAPAGS